MLRKFSTRPPIVIAIMVLQVIPLLMFPPSTFNPASQEWWLPVLLAILVVVSFIQLVLRRTTVLWPWYLLSFSQGFNIISRLMMFMPHASTTVGGAIQVDVLYIVLTVISVVLSTILIIYNELPDVRMSLYAQKTSAEPA